MNWVKQARRLSAARATAQGWHEDSRRFDTRMVRDEWVDAWARHRTEYAAASRPVQWWHDRTHGDPGDQPWPTTLAEFDEAYPGRRTAAS